MHILDCSLVILFQGGNILSTVNPSSKYSLQDFRAKMKKTPWAQSENLLLWSPSIDYACKFDSLTQKNACNALN